MEEVEVIENDDEGAQEEQKEQIEQSEVLFEVSASDDGVIGFLKLIRQDQNPKPVTKEMLFEELKAKNVVFGVKEDVVEKLALRPIYNIKIEVARGILPVSGEDGENRFLVKKDVEYVPEFDSEGIIDYKNIDYFQLVKKDQILCSISKEKPGVPGKNIYGGDLPARAGKPPSYPVGENTLLIDDNTLLVATCDGVVNYVRDTISIRNLLKISSDVDQHTGNINFSGDVTVEGDISNGFSLNVGGNLIIKGVIQDAKIDVGGNLHVSRGINGALKQSITVQGDMRCNYVENAIVFVAGNITADYIIDSKITCMGDIELKGGNEMVLGGDIKLKGSLQAKEIGSEKERVTRIEVLGERIVDTELLSKLEEERNLYNEKAMVLIEKAKTLGDILAMGNNEVASGQLALVKKQMFLIREKINGLSLKIEDTKQGGFVEYTGAVICKRKVYQGVKIFFGETRFRFSFDNIEHCRIYWNEGEIVQSTL